MPRNPEQPPVPQDEPERKRPPLPVEPSPNADPSEWAEYVLQTYEADGITEIRRRYNRFLEKYRDRPEHIARLQALAKKDPIIFSSVLRGSNLT